MNWKVLDTIEGIDQVIEESGNKPLVIYKHSTTCGVSAMAKMRLERNWDLDEDLDVYYLDLLSHRDVSNKVAETFQVRHESPQILLVKDGTVIFHTSHLGVSVDAIKDALSEVA